MPGVSGPYDRGPFSLDLRRHRILIAGKPIGSWSRLRFELFRILLEADGDVVPYDSLIQQVWGERDVTFHTVNKTAHDLSRSLGIWGDCIQNKHAVGFYFRPPATAATVKTDSGGPIDTEAQAHYEVGVAEWNRRTEASLQRALENFRRVLERYPDFVPALLGLADCLILLTHGGFPVLRKDVLPEAEMSIEKALFLAQGTAQSAAGHAMLGKLQLIHKWNWVDAEESLRHSIDLDPTHAPAHHTISQLFLITERPELALESIDRARRLSPASAMIHMTAGWLRYFLGHYEEAVTICRRVVQLHPEFAAGHAVLGIAYQGAGMMKEARDALETSRELSTSPNAIAGLGHLHGTLGHTSRARSGLGQLAAMQKRGAIVSPYFYALIHVGLGEADKALNQLQIAANERFDWLLHLSVESRWKPLHRDRRFKELLRGVGLDRAWR